MGFSSSQVSLLALTGRNHDISVELEHLSNDKESLTRRMQEVSKAYNNALSTKTLKWSNNSGVSYTNLNYSTLMTPSAANQNKPYLVTNSSGKIVLNNKYAKFASMISEDGSPNGDYESNRIYILSQLTGIPEDRFDNYGEKFSTTNTKADEYDKARNATTAARKKAYETLNSENFVKKWGNAGGIDFASKSVGKFGLVDIGDGSSNAKATLTNIGKDIVANLSPYLEDKDITALKEATDGVITNYTGLVESIDGGSSSDIVKKNGSHFEINMDDFISQIMGGFVSKCGELGSGCATEQSDGDYRFECIGGIGKDDDNYKAYLSAKAAEETAKAEYNNAINDENQVFTAEEETKIEFYDLIFNAIAEKGWIEDAQIEDSDYLNNTFQNNIYTITTVEENSNYDKDEKYDSTKKNQFNYTTDIASNFDKFFFVNDEDARQEALANYEYEKSIINSKESRIDTRMKNLETEQSAIKQMIKGIEQVEKDNIETFFSIFS